MTKTDTSLAKMEDIRTALMLLTRLPLPAGRVTKRFAEAAWAYPIVGLLLGGLAALIGLVLHWLGLAPALVAIAILATLTIVTGAMHEDGLADTADGFWGAWDKSRRLEIMKDSHIGSYGVLALILSFAARWAALTALVSQGGWVAALIATACLSRAAMPVVMHALPHARASGLSQNTGRPARNTMMLGLIIALGLSLGLFGWGAVKLALILGLTIFAMARLAQAKIGGQTGDTLGATQQICEITLLTALTL